MEQQKETESSGSQKENVEADKTTGGGEGDAAKTVEDNGTAGAVESKDSEKVSDESAGQEGSAETQGDPVTLTAARVPETDKTKSKVTEGEESADSEKKAVESGQDKATENEGSTDSEKKVLESGQQPDASAGDSSDRPGTEPEGSGEAGKEATKDQTDQLASSGTKVGLKLRTS